MRACVCEGEGRGGREYQRLNPNLDVVVRTTYTHLESLLQTGRIIAF